MEHFSGIALSLFMLSSQCNSSGGKQISAVCSSGMFKSDASITKVVLGCSFFLCTDSSRSIMRYYYTAHNRCIKKKDEFLLCTNGAPIKRVGVSESFGVPLSTHNINDAAMQIFNLPNHMFGIEDTHAPYRDICGGT